MCGQAALQVALAVRGEGADPAVLGGLEQFVGGR